MSSVRVAFTSLDGQVLYEHLPLRRDEQPQALLKRILLDGFTTQQKGWLVDYQVEDRVFHAETTKLYPNDRAYIESFRGRGATFSTVTRQQPPDKPASPAVRHHYVAPSRILGATWEEEV